MVAALFLLCAFLAVSIYRARMATRVPDNPGFPRSGDAPAAVINHSGFSLSYDERHEQASWVMYSLRLADLLVDGCERTDDFRPDTLVATETAAVDDYRYSGYDRGHLVPAADMKRSCEAMSESFLFSNISPQRPGFNRGAWRRLENRVRRWAEENEALFVVTGPVLEDSLPAIGENGVSVPRYFYKVLLVLEEPGRKGIAFLMPNERLEYGLLRFAVPIDSIETITGLDFFPALPASIQDEIESIADTLAWSL